MREIMLCGRIHGGLSAMVSDEDFDVLSKYRWYALRVKRSRTVYARASVGSKTVYMHHLVLSPKAGFEIDHIDRNGLNNQRGNLRLVTRSENMVNGQSPDPRNAAHVHTVRKTMADGTVKTFLYDRKTRVKVTPEEAEKRTKMETTL